MVRSSESNELKAKIDALIKDLGSEDQTKRQEAAKSLEEIGTPAEEPLEAILQNLQSAPSTNPNPELVSQAKELLARLALRSIAPDPEITKLKEKLTTITHDFRLADASLVDHTEHLTQLYDIPFYYEPSALESAQEKKTLTLRGLPLKVSLKHLLSQFGLSYTFRRQGIWLVKAGALIKELKIYPPAKVPELDKTVYTLLERKIELPFTKPAPLDEVLDFIRESIPELNIIASREVALKENLSVTLNNCPLGEAISEMLRSRNLGYLVNDGVLEVAPYQKVLKGLLTRLETIALGKSDLPPDLQIRYEVSAWKQDKSDRILILRGDGKTQFACLDKPPTLQDYYRAKTPKEDILRLLKTLLDNSFFAPEIAETNLEENSPSSFIKCSFPALSEGGNTYEYKIWFPLTLDAAIPEEEKSIRKLQTIEKELHQTINQIKQKGIRIKP